MCITMNTSLTFWCCCPPWLMGHRLVSHGNAVRKWWAPALGPIRWDLASFFFFSPTLTTNFTPSTVTMSSFLSDIIAEAPDTSSTPLTLPMQRNTQPTSDGDRALLLNSESEGLQDDDDNDDDNNNNSDNDNSDNSDNDNNDNDDAETQVSTRGSQNGIAAFTINTACNLRLTAKGESSLIRFSQVISFLISCIQR